MKKILLIGALLLSACDQPEYHGLTAVQVRAKVDKCAELHLTPRVLETVVGYVYDIICVPETDLDKA